MATFDIGKGTGGKVMVNGSEDPVCRTISWETSLDSEKVYAIGQIDAVATVTGTQEITGSYERYFTPDKPYVGNTGKTLAELSGATGTAPVYVNIKVWPYGTDTGSRYYNMTAKFKNFRLEVSPDAVVTETAELDIVSLKEEETV